MLRDIFQPSEGVSGSLVSNPLSLTGDQVRIPATELEQPFSFATQLDWMEISCAVVIKLRIYFSRAIFNHQNGSLLV